MQQFQFRADIYDIAPVQLHQLLRELWPELSFRSRLVGYQMFLEVPGLQMSIETMDESYPTYTLNARYETDETGAAAWAHALCQQLEEALLLYSLDYVEVDDQGNELGEEISFWSPDFEARYQVRRKAFE